MECIATTWQEAIQAFDRAEHAQAEGTTAARSQGRRE